MKYTKLTTTVFFLVMTGTTAAIAATTTDAAFLQSLARVAPQAPAQDEPLAGIGTPSPLFKTCTISRDCGDGNTVACTGNNVCSNTQKGVKCDTTEYPCPNYCVMSWRCDECPTYTGFCWSLRGDCGVTASACNGHEEHCFCPEYP